MADRTLNSRGRPRLRPLSLSVTAVAIAAIGTALFLLATHVLPGYGPATPAPKAYVGLFKDNTIGVVDTGTDRILKTIPIPPGPFMQGTIVVKGGSR
jgi:hypothetical protein